MMYFLLLIHYEINEDNHNLLIHKHLLTMYLILIEYYIDKKYFFIVIIFYYFSLFDINFLIIIYKFRNINFK